MVTTTAWTDNIIASVQARLPRRMTPQELSVLRHLTPQGVAKLNHDLCAGISLEQTLTELLSAYRTVAFQREYMEDLAAKASLSLPHWSKFGLSNRTSSHTGRPCVSVSQLTFLMRSTTKQLLRRVEKQVKQGNDDFSDALEEFVFRVVDGEQIDQLRCLTSDLRMPIAYITLSPTAWVQPMMHSTFSGPCLNHTITVEPHRILVGLNALTQWFVEPSTITPNVSPSPSEHTPDQAPAPVSPGGQGLVIPPGSLCESSRKGSRLTSSSTSSLPPPLRPTLVRPVTNVDGGAPNGLHPLRSALAPLRRSSHPDAIRQARSLAVTFRLPKEEREANSENGSPPSSQHPTGTLRGIKFLLSFWKRTPIRSSSAAHRKYLMPKLSSEAAGIML